MAFHKAARHLVKLAHVLRLHRTKAETTTYPLTGAIMGDLISCETRHCNYGAYPRLISASACHVVYTQRTEPWLCGSHLRPSLSSGGAIGGILLWNCSENTSSQILVGVLARWGNLETSQRHALLTLTPLLLFTCQVQGVCAHKRCQVVAEPLEKCLYRT